MNTSRPSRTLLPPGLAVLAIAVLTTLASTAWAQLTGTRLVPGDYPTLADAIADLNAQGVGAGGVTISVQPGNPETAPAGGYVIGGAGSALLATSSAANPVVVQGGGNTITASGALTAGSLTDAIFKLIGADFVTVTGFTMQENPANTTTAAATNNMTEWGVALLHVSTTDGAQNNTIQDNTISLNRAYTNTWGVYANNRHSATTVTVTEDVTDGTTGPNSNNRVYGNAIGNVNMGIAFIGTGVPANQDVGNDVGGASAGTGNTITNWGGAAAASGFVSNSGTSYAVFMNHQTADNVSWNTLISAAVSGTSVTFRGILKDYTVAAPTGTFTSSITHNTVTMTSGFTSGTFEGIRSQGMTALNTATIQLTSNTILNCAVTGATSSSTIVGIVNSSAPGVLNMNLNVVRGTTSTATTGGFTGLSNTGAVVTAVSLSNNQIGNASGGAITFNAATSGAVNAITSSGGAATATTTITGNDVRGITHAVNGTSTHTYVINSAATLSQNLSNNTFTNLSVATSGSVTFLSNNVTAPTGGSKTINGNSIVTGFAKTVAGGTVTLYADNASSVAGVVVNNLNNNFSNLSVTGATTIAGWSNTDGGQPTKTIQGNVFSNWTGGTSAVTAMNINFGTTSTTTVTQNTVGPITSGGAITGLVLGSSIGTANASQNTITGLASTGTGSVQGITSAATTSNVSKNRIADLSGGGAASVVNGVLVSAGTTVSVANNLIGDLRAPAATGTADAIRGISLTSTTATSNLNLSYNSIWLNASSTGANFSSSGIFHTTSATATTAALTMRDNVVVNLSTPAGTGVTSAYRRSSTTLTNYATASNNNLLYAGTPAANRVLYFDGTNSDATLGAFKVRVSPREVGSVTENPPFLSTAAGSPSFLHVDPSIGTQIESGGTPIAGLADDFDGDARNATTPDIGADEGNFTLADFAAPAITYTPLGNTTPAGTVALGGVVVTDASGVDGASGTRPRVYYKRSTNANALADNTSATDGWKFVEATGSTSPFAFTIDHSLLFGGPVIVGDQVQYFVVAQDLAATPNVGLNSGTFAAAPASVALTGAAFPIGGTIRSYTIVDVPLSGDYTVGLSLFNQVAGKQLGFERRVSTVTRSIVEPQLATPQTDGSKAVTEMTFASQLAWKTTSVEVEEVTWVPVENGREYTGDLFVKRSADPSLPEHVMAGVYPTLTAAVNDLNLRGVSGAVRFLLLDSTYPTETLPITVNVGGPAPTATNTVTILPSTGVTTTVSGASAGSAILKVFGTSHVTIDGSNSGGTTRDLTLENTSATSPNVVWFGSNGTTPVTGLGLKNCVVRNGATTSSAVLVTDGTTAGSPGFFSSVEVRNNQIEKAFIGVYANGGTTPANGGSLTFANNQINTSGANAVRLVGLYMQGVNGAAVSDNTIGNFDAVDGENDMGIWLATGTSNATVSGNTVANLGYTGTSGFGPVGIHLTSGVSPANVTIARNTVTGIVTNGSTAVRGIASITTTTTDVVLERNNVSGVTNSNAGTFGAYGIDVAGGSNHTVRNNFVSDVKFNMTGGAAFSTQFGVFGIRVASGTGHVIADNSVNLFGAIPGTANSSLLSAALAVVGTTSTNCDIRNNVLSNTLSGGTTAIAHVAAYLPSGGTSAMNLTWNNNAYNAGADVARQGLAQTGTTAGTGFYLPGNFNPAATSPASNFRAYTSALSASGTNDSASVVTSPPFVSSTDLHLQTTIPTPLESAGAPLAAVTNDFDGDARNATTPDIGADEGNFLLPNANDLAATSLDDPTNGGSKSAGIAFTPKATFTNVGSAPQTNVPVRFRIVDAGSVEVYNQTTTIASLNPAASGQATFPAVSLAAGAYTMEARAELPGDVTPVNDVVAGSFSVLAPLAGTYAVGSAQAAPFDRLTTAVARLNQLGVSAAVTFELTDATYSAGETFPITIQTVQGGSATNTFTLKPASGVTAAITGSSTSAILILNGADWVTVDGSNNGSSSRDLTLANTSTSGSSAVVWAQNADTTNGVSSVTLQNLIATGNGSTQTLVGIGFGGSAIGVTSNGRDHDGNVVRNCAVSRVQYGIYSAGQSAGNKNSGTQILGNAINATSPNNVSIGGIYLRFEDGALVEGNQVGEITRASGTNFGIALGLAAATNLLNVTSGDEVTNSTVSRNRVTAVASPSTTGFSAVGVQVGPTLTGTNVIVNNMISGITSPATPSDATMGVFVVDSLGTTRLLFNSVSLTGARGAASNPSFALAIKGTAPDAEIRGNALANAQTSTSTGKSYAVGLAGTSLAGFVSDRNDLYVVGDSSRVGIVGGFRVADGGVEQPTLADWQTATSQDAGSVSGDPRFAGTNDLHVASSGAPSALSDAALPVAGVVVDFDGEPRSLTRPDIGADEFADRLLFVSDVSANEGNSGTTNFAFRVSLRPASPDTVRVDVATLDGTAVSPADFAAISPAQTLTFAPGDTQVVVTVAVVGETAFEPNETFQLLASNATNARIGDSLGVGTIVNDDVNVGVDGDVPAHPYFAAAFPNPFRASSTLEFGLSRTGPLTLRVYDISGRQVRVLRDGTMAAGRHRLSWNGADDQGRALPAGLYLVRMRTAEVTFTRRISLVR